MVRTTALAAALAVSVWSQSQAFEGVGPAAKAGLETRVAATGAMTSAGRALPRREARAALTRTGTSGRSAGATGPRAAQLAGGGAFGALMTLLRPAGSRQQQGLSYPVSDAISLGVGYDFVSGEMLEVGGAETGSLAPDYNSHNVVLRASWRF